MRFVLRIARAWLPLALAITIGSAGLYAVVQQTYRTGANDPQIQLAEDGAARLADGTNGSAVVAQAAGSAQHIDLARSLAPFVIVYDTAGAPIASSGLLDGTIPVPPLGVLDAARASGRNTVTWQPRRDVRIAAVIVPGGKNGFVLAGRSLREVERRESALTTIVGFGWLVALGSTLVAAAGLEWLVRRAKAAQHAASSAESD